MKKIVTTALVVAAMAINVSSIQHVSASQKPSQTEYQNQTLTLDLSGSANKTLTAMQKQKLFRMANRVAAHVTEILPGFPEQIAVAIDLVDKDLDKVGGVTGIAQTPTLVNIEISKTFHQGIDVAIEKGLQSTLYHEFHHLARGWTIEGNKFGPGIAIAAVNEGLASVFAEQYSGVKEHWLNYPDDIALWVDEILHLPVNAPYQMWMMGTHSDGREFIGYKAGKYIVHQAMDNAEYSIATLSALGAFEILNLSGVIEEHAPSLEKLGDFYAKHADTRKAIAAYERAIRITPQQDIEQLNRYRKKQHLLENPIAMTKKHLQKLAGQYTSEGFELSVSISSDGQYLQMQLPGRPPFRLHPDSEHSFFIYEADVRLNFKGQNENASEQLLVTMFGREVLLSKV